MQMKTTYGFSRRGPDRVAEELATVLSRKASFEFKALFDIVHNNLRERNAAGGGEEMLRLRAYEKLQNLVRAGIVKKVGKEYRGNAAALTTFLETSAELNAKFAAGIAARTPPPPPPPVPMKKPVPVKAHLAKAPSVKVKPTKVKPTKAIPAKVTAAKAARPKPSLAKMARR